MEEDSNQLIEAPEDEDINDLNDLTFGDSTDNFDVDWERHHEELTFSGSCDVGLSHLTGYAENDIDFDELHLQESMQTDLEHKLSQLVVDDDDDVIDDEDHATNTVPIKQKRQPVSLDELFGPQSPPGLFDAEDLVMGHTNIWGSPVRDSHIQGNCIQGLLRTLLQKPTATNRGESAVVPSTAKTLEEIEQALFHNIAAAAESLPPPPPRLEGGARVLTVEELEKQLRGENVDGASTGSTMTATTAADGAMPRTSLPPSSAAMPVMSAVPGGVGSMTRPVGARIPGLVTLPSGVALRMQSNVAPQGAGGIPPRVGNTVRPSPYSHQPGQQQQQPFWPPNAAAMQHQRLMMNNMALTRMMGARGMNVGRYPGSIPPPQGYPGFGFNTCGPMGAGLMRHPAEGNQFGQHRHFMPPMPNDRLPFMNRTGPQPLFPGMQRGPPSQQQHNNAAGGGGSVFPLQRQQLFQQQQMMMRQQMRSGIGTYGSEGMRMSTGGPMPRHWQPVSRSEMSDDGAFEALDVEDEYAGLMTQREKDWVIKIQMLQLHTDNPYVDDYYYTCWSVKRMLKERQQREEGLQTKLNDDNEPKLVLPQLAKLETRAYMPAHFEGALGRLTSASIHNPRQTITVHFASGSETDEVRGVVEVKRFKELLLHIEKGYDSLLDIEDTEKKADAQPPENRQTLYDERSHLIAQLYHRLKGQVGSSSDQVNLDKTLSLTSSNDNHDGDSSGDDGLAQIIAIHKGLYLVLRLAPLLDKADAQNVVCLLLRKMATRKDWPAEMLVKVYKVVSNTIDSANLDGLVLFAGALCHGDTSIAVLSSSPTPFDKNAINRLMLAAQNKFGVSVILKLLNRGEIIYSTQSPLDLDAAHQNEWRQFVEIVASAMELCEKASLSKSVEPFQLAASHLRRLLDKHSMLLVEDWLEIVLPPLCPAPPAIPIT